VTSPSGVVSAVLAAVVFPVVAGLGVALLGWTVFHPWILGPALAGLVAGSATGLAAWRLGVRARRTLILVGALGAGLSYATVFVADYAFFVRNMRLQFLIHYGAVDEEASAGSRLDRVLREETGRSGFAGFVLLQLGQGAPVGGTTLRGPLLGGLWAIELFSAICCGAWSADPGRRRIGPRVAAVDGRSQVLEDS